MSSFSNIFGPRKNTGVTFAPDGTKLRQAAAYGPKARADDTAKTIRNNCGITVAKLRQCNQVTLTNSRLKLFLKIPLIRKYFPRGEVSVESKLEKLDALFNASANTIRAINETDDNSVNDQANVIIRNFLMSMTATDKILEAG
ncbi:MAG: hypothetical protein WCT39_01955, partial [Candidatus Margulisiibacteriota bacterium]